MKLLGFAMMLAACSHGASPPTPPVAPPPAKTTTCYAGTSLGMGQTARTIARRTVDPAAKQIIEDVSHDDAGGHGVKSFHVVMAVDDDHFTITEAGNAFHGAGTLVGDPWRWTSWTSTSEFPATGLTVDSDDELTEKGMSATKRILRGGKQVATSKDELKTFDCADWDKAVAALTIPPLESGGCERACRNFAQLKFWASANPAIAALPEADRAAALEQKTADMNAKIEAGLGACVSSCVSANNVAETACMATANSVDALAACE
jgi:hypothetical protein